MSEIIKKIEKAHLTEQKVEFGPGDTISVSIRIREGEKTRLQAFQGVVIQRKGSGMGQTFTVRKASGSVYVERIFPSHSPLISEIKLIRRGRVRRAKLYFLRERTGKSARLRERK